MACVLKPECNFLHGYFTYFLPVETMDVEVKIKTMKGIHMFWRDRTTQVISCNPWSSRVGLYPSLIRKMRTYLELEGKLSNQPCTNVSSPNTISLLRKTPTLKKAGTSEKKI